MEPKETCMRRKMFWCLWDVGKAGQIQNKELNVVSKKSKHHSSHKISFSEIFPFIENHTKQVKKISRFHIFFKVIHPKYYKHLKKGAHQNHLGSQEMGWFLAGTSSKTKILNKKGI